MLMCELKKEMSNNIMQSVKYGAMLSSVIIGLAVISYCGDFIFAWVLRDLCGITMGFPTSYQVPTKVRNDLKLKWFKLGTIRAGRVVTNTMVSAATEDGLAFEMRSLFGFRTMNTVLIPWSEVRFEKTKDGAFNGDLNKIYIVNNNDIPVNNIELGTSDARWLAYVTRRSGRLPPAPPKHD
jgi:hypothetical protein